MTTESNRTKAYTLVELLVVIAIIAIAFSVIFIGANPGDGVRLASAQRTVSGLVKAARAQALLRNTQVRLIIYDDNATSSEVDKYRRFVGIIYDSDPGTAESWIAADKGTFLPRGIYFDEDNSSSNSGGSWSGPTMNIDYPRLTGQNGSSGTQYLYYQFSDNGTVSTSNAWIVFRAGQFIPGDTAPTFPAEKANLKAALILRQSGTATLVNDPASI